jgi:glycine/D-amino acid oxidase-like deaminating enzyme
VTNHTIARKHAASSGADVAVIGGGVIGLSTALALSDAGAMVALVADERPGAASGAAAGLLAPSIGSLTARVAEFFAASLAAYPAYLARVQSIDPGLQLITGLIEIGSNSLDGSALTQRQIAELEPNLHAPGGGRLHEADAAIDIGRLLAALRRVASMHRSIQIASSDPAVRVDADGVSPSVVLRSGRRIDASYVVLAAGAWTPVIEGLPRRLPVFPLKGQMLAVESSALRHPVMGEDVYLVPRAGEIAIGATVEHAGFDLSTDDAAIDRLRAAATRLVPSLASARETRRWAGIRPATPDMLPVLGPDIEHPRLLYACGHSKNGILLAPATAACVASLAAGRASSLDIGPFALDRFPREVTPT